MPSSIWRKYHDSNQVRFALWRDLQVEWARQRAQGLPVCRRGLARIFDRSRMHRLESNHAK